MDAAGGSEYYRAMPRLRIGRTFLIFILTCALWGSSYIAVKIGLRYAPPLTYGGLRMALAGGVLLLYAWARGASFPRRWDDWWRLALLGFFTVTLVTGTQFVGLQFVSAAESSILLNVHPLFVAVLAVFFLGERLTWMRVVGLLCSLVGLVLVFSPQLQVDSLARVGSLILVGGSLSWAISSIMGKRLLPKLNLLSANAIQITIGALPLLLVGMLIEGTARWHPAWEFFAAWTYVALIPTAFAYSMWFYLLLRGEATQMSAYMFLIPVFGVFYGFLLLGERLAPIQLLGAVFVAAGIYSVNRPSAPPAEPVPSPETLTPVER